MAGNTDGSGDRRGTGAGRRDGARRDERPRSGERGRPGERGRSGERGRPGSDRRGGRDRAGDSRDPRSRDAERTVDQETYDGPPIPDEVTAKDLDKSVMRGLNSLPDKLADRVARHLVMAGRLLDEEPAVAYKHAQAARARASRVAVVREACGETAYASGKFAEALSELRAAKRLNGAWYYTPMMADCERALKRPERAVAMAKPETHAKLDQDGQVELSIVAAGARRDMGQPEAAIRLLEAEPLHTNSRAEWVARLRYAYADALLAAGREADALEWFHRTEAVDGNRMTDAREQVARLEESGKNG